MLRGSANHRTDFLCRTKTSCASRTSCAKPYNANRNHLAVLFSWRAGIEVFDKSNFVDANCVSAAREFPLTSGLFPAMEKPRSDGGIIGKTRMARSGQRFFSVFAPFFIRLPTVFYGFSPFLPFAENGWEAHKRAKRFWRLVACSRARLSNTVPSRDREGAHQHADRPARMAKLTKGQSAVCP